jgi:hypothetical protein
LAGTSLVSAGALASQWNARRLSDLERQPQSACPSPRDLDGPLQTVQTVYRYM